MPEPESSDATLDMLYDGIDDLLSSGRFAFVDWILASLHLDLPPDVWLALLTITLPAESKLPHRAEKLEKVRSMFRADADVILKGLE